MDDHALQRWLVRLFERHEVQLDPDEDGWLLTDGDFPAIRASWRQGRDGEPGRLDIDVVPGDDRCIEDSFAGTDVHEAQQAFERGCLYPLLAACWYVTDDRHMRIAAWDIGIRSWDVFIGPLTMRGAAVPEESMPPDAALALRDTVGQLSLSPELHWLHLLHRRTGTGSFEHEALLDGEPWAQGTQMLDTWTWPELPVGASARQMVLLDVRDY